MKDKRQYPSSCIAIVLAWQLVGCGGDNGSDDHTDITAIETAAPVITLNGARNIEVAYNAVFNDLGAVAVDGIDGKVPVSTKGNIDTKIPGSYELTYTATDSSGNLAKMIRTVEVLKDSLLTATVMTPRAPSSFFFDGVLRGADYWSNEPKILSAGVGFDGIVGIEASTLTIDTVREAGGAWSSDINCGTNTRNYTSTSTQVLIGNAYIQQTPYGKLKVSVHRPHLFVIS